MSCGHRASKKAVQNGKDRATKANAADDFHHVCMSMSASTGEYGLCTGTDCVCYPTWYGGVRVVPNP